MNFESIKNTLTDLQKVISQLSETDFCMPIDNLSGASIGEHSRHIIELFQSVIHSYSHGVLNYDNRERNKMIQTNKEFANFVIDTLLKNIEKPNKSITLEHKIAGETNLIQTNYFREMLYNLEHCIHHQALIKVALFQLQYVKLNDDFGVAASTIEFRKQCVQ
jgi:6-pyruvoyl-tetrahydropterin synthase